MSSQVSHKIKNRKVAKDVFITPRDLAKAHVNMIEYTKNDIWLDPCRFNELGSYYSQFPSECKKCWFEIQEGKDFLKDECNDKPTIICCNLPYSIIDVWLDRCIELNPRIISFLIGVHNLTAKRTEKLEKAGYGLSRIKMMKVFDWYGMSAIVVFEKGKKGIIEYDRKVYHTEKL